MSDEQKFPACKGMNCGCTDGRSHSLECHAEHAAAIAGGRFVKGTARVEALCRVPEGWRLVPVEPTSAMADASWTAISASGSATPADIWSAMLAAAPHPPGTAPKREALSEERIRELWCACKSISNEEFAVEYTRAVERELGGGNA